MSFTNQPVDILAPRTVNLSIYAGSDFFMEFSVLDETGDFYEDITDDTIRGRFKTSVLSSAYMDFGVEITSGYLGQFALFMASENTILLKPGNGVFDLVLSRGLGSSSSGNSTPIIKTLATGIVTVYPAITNGN